MKNSIFLASKSPRRRELLRQIGVDFCLIEVDVEEVHRPSELPIDYVQRLSLSKARAGAECTSDAPVLGADTIVVFDGRILEKPRHQDDAVQMLLSLSNATHRVYTAIALCQHLPTGKFKESSIVCCSEVTFRGISRDEAQNYWHTGEPKDKAGGYGIQGFGAVFVAHLQGSYSNVVGLPLMETQKLLADFKITVWNTNE